MVAVVTRWPEERVEGALRRVGEVGLKQAAIELGMSDAGLRSMFNHKRIDWKSARPALPSAPALAGVSVSERAPVLPPVSGRELEAPPLPVVPGEEMTVSLLGDLHAPEQDNPAWNACLRWHAEHQPDVIVATEMGEWLSMTRHGGNWGAMFAEDVKATRKPLVQLRSVCPDARIVLLEANHDTRMLRRIAELMPQMVGRLSIPSELKLDDLGIDWVPESIAFRIGRLKVIHGHQLSGGGRFSGLPENACKRAIQRYGEPGWTVVFFHTHRKGYWMERRDTGALEAVNLPCLRTLNPDWTAPVPTGWQHGFGVAHVGPAGQTNLYSVDIEHGSFVYGAKRYSAAA